MEHECFFNDRGSRERNAVTGPNAVFGFAVFGFAVFGFDWEKFGHFIPSLFRRSIGIHGTSG